MSDSDFVDRVLSYAANGTTDRGDGVWCERHDFVVVAIAQEKTMKGWPRQ